MKRRTRAPFAAAVSIAAVLFACVLSFFIMKTYSLTADEDEVTLAIDYMDDAEAWTADDENVYVLSRGYTLSTSGSKGGDDDNGYLFVRVNSVPEDGAFHISRTFDEPLNLYSYSDIALMCSLVEGSEACEYTVAVTLLSDSASNPTFTSSAFLTPDGEWHTLSFSLEGWAGRGGIVGIEIELSIVGLDGYSIEGESLTLRLDALTATGAADTSAEEKFTASAFYADGAALTYNGDAFLWSAYDGGSVSWSPIFESEDSLAGHDTLALSVIADAPAVLSLGVTYKTAVSDDAAEENEEETPTGTLSGDGALEILYFDVENIYDIDLLTLKASFEGEESTTADIKICGIYTLEYPSTSSSGTGSLDSCRMTSEGVLSLGGVIPSSVVAEYMDAELVVYAVPMSSVGSDAELEAAIEEAEPIVSSAMTTRFKIKIDSGDLPLGYDALMYVVVIEAEAENTADAEAEADTQTSEAADANAADKKTADETSAEEKTRTVKIRVGSPLPISYDGIGVSIPSRGMSKKGLIASFSLSGALSAETVVTVDVSELLSGGRSGRIYSVGGQVYYFDSEYLTSLDAVIKPLSLSGTKCYLMITGGASYEGELDSEVGGLLYAVTDFLTDRYESSDYGYISGIILDLQFSDDAVGNAAPDTAAALAMAYTIGNHKLDGFSVFLAVSGDVYSSGFYDTLLYLDCVSIYMSSLGVSDWELYWQTGSMATVPIIRGRVSSLLGSSPSNIAVEYSPIIVSYGSAGSVMYDYINAYYTAAEYDYVGDFFFNLTSSDVGEDDEMMSSLIELFKLLDTDLYETVEEAASEAAVSEGFSGIKSTAVASAHPYTYGSGEALYTESEDTLGEYVLFDFRSIYDTDGWFSGGTSECSSVKYGTDRAMRAESAADGIIYYFSDGVDLSGSPIIALCCSVLTEGEAEFEALFISDTGAYSVSFVPSSDGDGYVYFDLSSFDGASGIKGIYIHATEGDGSFYVRTLSLLSGTLTDEELAELYSSAGSGDEEETIYEENIIMIVAVVFCAVIMTAGGYAFFHNIQKSGGKNQK